MFLIQSTDYNRVCHPAYPTESAYVELKKWTSVSPWREITRHASVEHIDIAELDAMVIETSKKYFPGMSCGFDDPRVHVRIGDGIKWVGDAEPAGTFT